MKIVYINWLAPDIFGWKWVAKMQRLLARNGHVLEMVDLQPHGNVAYRRLVMCYRLLKTVLCARFRHHYKVLYNPYCMTWCIPLFWAMGVRYAIDTTDAQDLPEMMSLINAPWTKRLWFGAHYYAWALFLQFAHGAHANNHKALKMAASFGMPAYRMLLMYDMTLDEIEMSHRAFDGNPPVIGYIGSEGTEFCLGDYTSQIKTLIDKGYRVEAMGCSEAFCNSIGAVRIPWTHKNACTVPRTWLCGLSLLPMNSRLDGKVAGKLFQYFAAGIPVVSSVQGEVAHMGLDASIIFIRKPEDLLTAIYTLNSNRAMSYEMGARGRREIMRMCGDDMQLPLFEKWLRVMTR